MRQAGVFDNPAFFAWIIRYNSSMDRDVLLHLPVVLAVAERKGFALAAKQLGMTPSNVSHAVRVVEDRLGMPIFARSTRSVALTEAGRALIAQCAPAMEDLDCAWEDLRSHRGKPSGHLRINIPTVAQPTLTPFVLEMTRRYPDVTIELFSDDRLADVVGEGFDAGVRTSDIIAADMVTVRLTPPFPVIVLASPDYIARHGKPKTIADLEKHVLICYRMITANALYAWEFQDQGRAVAFETRGPVIVNATLQGMELAAAGVGIVCTYEPAARNYLADGRLVQLLPKFTRQLPGLFLYFPKRASIAPKLRAFITVARDVLKARSRGKG
jgi:DNA-binding transcriptional LysR family regulator